MREVDHEACLIAARLMQQDIRQLSGSPVFLDLYEMAKDLLLNDRLPLQQALSPREIRSDVFDFFNCCPTLTSR
jgi:hypothetical protein